MNIRRKYKGDSEGAKAEDFISGKNISPSPNMKANKILISLKLDPELLARIDDAAKKNGISRAALISISCSSYLSKS